MEFGIPREIRDQEGRVALTPAGVGALVDAGHTVYVERQAGKIAGFSDEEYLLHGGHTVYSAEEAYRRAEIVVKVARPTAQEHEFFQAGQTLLSFLHLSVASPDLLEALQKQEMTAIAWELVATSSGRRPVLEVMSDIAGRLAPVIAGSLLQSGKGARGILLNGVPGVPPATVVILGAGELGSEAACTFHSLGAQVIVLDSNPDRLRELHLRVGHEVVTMHATPHALQQVMAFADVLIGATAVPGRRSPVLITREMVRTMRPGAVILDFAVDSGGCVETTRPTTHRDPTYIEEGVIHYAVPTAPALVARTASHALTNVILPYLLTLDELAATQTSETVALRKGLIVHQGALVHEEVARSLGREVER